MGAASRIARHRPRSRALACAIGLALGVALGATPAASQSYDVKLLRIAELLGTLHYLRDLCGAGEGMLWRDTMSALITAEDPSPARRTAFVDRFNRGYQGVRDTYQVCTPAAVVIVERSMTETTRLIREIKAQYGE